jgi:hypothetical protein
MGKDDKMIIDVNGGSKFDIDFESVYKEDQDTKESIFEYWHPCYVVNEETVPQQDSLLGRPLSMYGLNSQILLAYPQANPFNTSSQNQQQPPFLRILDTSTCLIGLANPAYRISDESFCRTTLSRSQMIVKRYTAVALVNFTIIGFVAGVVVSFVVYFVQRWSGALGSDVQSDRVKRRLERWEQARDAEAVMAADVSFHQVNSSGKRRRRGTGTGINDSTFTDGSGYTEDNH